MPISGHFYLPFFSLLGLFSSEFSLFRFFPLPGFYSSGFFSSGYFSSRFFSSGSLSSGFFLFRFLSSVLFLFSLAEDPLPELFLFYSIFVLLCSIFQHVFAVYALPFRVERAHCGDGFPLHAFMYARLYRYQSIQIYSVHWHLRVYP